MALPIAAMVPEGMLLAGSFKSPLKFAPSMIPGTIVLTQKGASGKYVESVYRSMYCNQNKSNYNKSRGHTRENTALTRGHRKQDLESREKSKEMSIIHCVKHLSSRPEHLPQTPTSKNIAWCCTSSSRLGSRPCWCR
jgi:hypothetical protein